MNPNSYRPEIKDIKVLPDNPVINSTVDIYIRVIDKYGEIEEVILYYTNDQGNFSTQMKLINGVPSNGTYFGVIPPLYNKENNIIKYKFLIKDNLGYSYNSTFTEYVVSPLDDVSPQISVASAFVICDPLIIEKVLAGIEPHGGLYCVKLEKLDNDITRSNMPLIFQVDLFDNGTGIRNATLYYSTDTYLPISFDSIDLKIFQESVQDGVYSGIGIISPLNKDKNITYYIETYDYASNKDISDVNSLPFIPENREDYADSFIVDSNSSTIYADIIQIDVNNLIGSAIFSISGKEITKFQSYNKLFGSIPPITVLSVDKEFNNLANEGFQKSAVIDRVEYSGGNTGKSFGSNVTTPSLKILGHPSKYPFDHYFFNFIIFIPIKNATLDYSNEEVYRNNITFDDQEITGKKKLVLYQILIMILK